jgi:hypothetical protein
MTTSTKIGVMMMTTSRVLIGTWPAASLHGWNVAEDAIEITMTCVMPSTSEMDVAESKTSAEIGSMKSKNSAMKGTMIIMVLTTTNLTGSIHQKGDTSQESSRLIPEI